MHCNVPSISAQMMVDVGESKYLIWYLDLHIFSLFCAKNETSTKHVLLLLIVECSLNNLPSNASFNDEINFQISAVYPLAMFFFFSATFFFTKRPVLDIYWANIAASTLVGLFDQISHQGAQQSLPILQGHNGSSGTSKFISKEVTESHKESLRVTISNQTDWEILVSADLKWCKPIDIEEEECGCVLAVVYRR